MQNEAEELRQRVAQLENKCMQLEKGLAQSEERFNKIFHTSHNPMVITTLKEARIVDLNEASAVASGCGRKELIGQLSANFNPFVEPEQKEALDKLLKKDGWVHNFELKLTTRSGKEQIVLYSAHPITLNDEPCLFSTSVDITERKQVERALQESEERFRLIADTIDEIFWISEPDGSTVYISPAHERIWGTSRSGFFNGDQAFFGQIHPDDRDRVAAVGALMKEGRPLEYEHRIIRPDGSIRYLWNRCFPVLDESGQIKRYVGVKQDITARWNAEEALKESRGYLDQIINSLGDPIFVKDENHTLMLVNNAFCNLMGKPREELIGATADAFLPPTLAASILKQEKEVFHTGIESVTEEEFPDGRGSIRSMMTKKTMLTGKGAGKQIVGVLRDITEYKRLQAQYLQSQKMEAVGLLAGGVAHDFNNLLTVVKGYTEILAAELDPDDPKQQDLQQIAKAGQQAATLTKQLLAFSRKQILQPKILNLNTILEEMGKMLRRLIGEDIHLVLSVQPDLHLILADPGQIQQIIMNLVINARDAMPQGGRLIIETSNAELDASYAHEHSMVQAGAYVMLSISDSGIGMDKETQAHIFEPFFTTKRQGEGSGLGLATVYGIIRQSGGYIWTYSEPGKGTTFKIYFSRAAGKAAPLSSESKTEQVTRGSETLLLVEDEESVRTLACRILQQQGYTVLEAADGHEALALAGKYPGDIQLVITDVVMPGMSGKELTNLMSKMRPGIQSLYISGYTDKAIVHHGILDSEVAFLQKPFTLEGLVRKVHEVIRAGDSGTVGMPKP